MPNIDELLSRIDGAFNAGLDKIKALQTQKTQEYHDRHARLEKFDQQLTQLREVWRPRLEALAGRFGEKVKVTPTVTPRRRDATFAFNSDLAHIDLRFSVVTDSEVRKAVFCFDLQILPILMKFDSHSEIEFPIDSIDSELLARWIDDRIVSFITTYHSLHENALYLKGHMVEDPIAKMQFPKFAAAATAEFDGKTHYFISEETCREFSNQRKASAAPR